MWFRSVVSDNGVIMNYTTAGTISACSFSGWSKGVQQVQMQLWNEKRLKLENDNIIAQPREHFIP